MRLAQGIRSFMFAVANMPRNCKMKVFVPLAATPPASEPRELAASGIEAGYIGRIRNALGDDNPSAFAKRAGVSRSFMHEVLHGKKAPSLALMFAVADTSGWSLEWLASGKGMPSDEFKAITALIPHFMVDADASLLLTGKKTLVGAETLGGVLPGKAGLVLAPDDGLAPMIQIADELLIELEPAEIVDEGVYIMKYDHRLIIRRIKHTASSALILSTGNMTSFAEISTLAEENHIVLARVITVTKRLVPRQSE